ncbi:hypothetical protein [Streptomyces sp. NBC_00233]|uniref:hypothetical protein n=1 Tax=Streptomyces sp. NBC_00233 TaxID=2975686 RepID=UPI002254A60E|nr:hypothetical protein [Streptomyces sp. NBC_00233]MCX5233213.1 hypothetical protein [Streptomyces sp. NBC_00233]
MVDVEELLGGVPVKLAPAQAVRARGERRRARQRRAGLATGALIVVAVAGIGSWIGLAPTGPHGADVASEGGNPFMSHGTVQNLTPSDLPMHRVLNWKVDSKDSDDNASQAALPQAGLDGVCSGSPGSIEEPQQQFTSAFTGKGDAKARYRVSQYANTDQALDAIRGLGQTLRGCGLKAHKDGSYSGMLNGNGPRLAVSVRHWKTWVGVIEAQYSPTR